MRAIILHNFYGDDLIYIRTDAIDLIQAGYDAELQEPNTTILVHGIKVRVREDMATCIELIKKVDKESEGKV